MLLPVARQRSDKRQAVIRAAGQTGCREFHELAAGRAVVPVWRELMADTVTPVGAFAQVVGDEPGFLLESVEGGDRWGRYSFVGRRPLGTLVGRRGQMSVRGDLALPPVVAAQMERGVLATVEALLEAFRS